MQRVGARLRAFFGVKKCCCLWRTSGGNAITDWPDVLKSGMPSHDKFFYGTGRLTSEMVIKAAQMGIPVVVSRSGITQMGHMVAQRLGLCAIGRATNKRFLCFTGAHRLVLQPELAGARLQAAA